MDESIEEIRARGIERLYVMRDELLADQLPGHESRVKRVETAIFKLTGKRCESVPQPTTGKKRQRWKDRKKSQ
jgi:hypothetical protein